MRIASDVLRRCWILAGPTATGKTAAGLCLADPLHAEIVSLDSMSVYRGMDIGTAKPSREERARVPHHLVDILEPHQEYSLAEYLKGAESACREILARGKTPLFVGGTGLYLRTLLRGIFEGPSADPAIRQDLEWFAQERGEQALHDRLRSVDAQTANLLHPRDRRRIVRALEVYESTGIPLSAHHHEAPLPASQRPEHVYWLEPPRSWLHARINERVERMMQDGLVEEVRRILDGPFGYGKTASQALGYKEVIEHLTNGLTIGETTSLIQTRTRQFAKRQHTWFRNLEECRAVAITGTELPHEIAQKLLGG